MHGELSFGHWLQQRRKALDLTQRMLAQQAGCTAVTIHKLETNQRRPSRQLAERLADALQIPPTERPTFQRLARGHAVPPALAHTEEYATQERLPVPSLLAASRHVPPQRSLPVPLTPLIGRDADAAAVRDLLARPGVRLLTLVGPPGIGKTRLGLRVAAELRDSFAGGILWVPLAALQDARLVLPAIAQVLDVREAGGQSLRDTLVNVLQQEQMLLLLDNFEHVATAATDLADLLEHVPGLKVLATSRAALRIAGEHIWTVPPLTFPDVHNLPALDVLASYPAMQLFIQRSQAVDKDFALTDANAAAVAAICACLEGVPLAIELAAARSHVLSPQALLERLDQRLSLLTGGVTNAPARHQSLRAAIAWSYDLLSPEEQALFRRLGVFVGGCTLEAVAAVCGDGVTPGVEGGAPDDHPPTLQPAAHLALLDRLTVLADQSLLRRRSGTGGEPRFTMLGSIREFALEQLEVAGEAEVVRRRHAAYFLHLAQTAEAHLYGPDQIIWLDRLQAEHANFRAVLAWEETPPAADLYLPLATALWQFWTIRGHWSEGRSWLLAALEGHPQAPSDVRALALAQASEFTWRLGDYEDATRLAEASLAVDGQPDHQAAKALALVTLGWVAYARSDYATAVKLFQESLRRSRHQGDTYQIANTLYCLGFLAQMQGEHASAAAYYNETLSISQTMGDKHSMGAALAGLGDVALRQRYYDQAHQYYQESLAIAREFDDKNRIGASLSRLGDIARIQGAYADAEAYYEESWDFGPKQGYKMATAFMLYSMGYVAIQQGRIAQAAARFTESLRMYQVSQHKDSIAICVAGLAAVATAQGQTTQAARLYGFTAGLFDVTDYQMDPADQIDYERNLAALRAQLDTPTFAAAWSAGRALSPDQAISEAMAIAEAAQSAPDSRPIPTPSHSTASLTEREVEVLRLVAQGLTNPQIAEQLIISPRTVHAHLRAIYSKLEVANRSAATRFALEHGLV